jgi:hypothetical protein
MLENTEGAIKKEQSRETGNKTKYEQNPKKTNKQTKHKTTQYVLDTTMCK